MEGMGDHGNASNKLPPEIAHAKERLNIPQVSQGWPVCNGFSLFGINCGLAITNDHPEILYRSLFKLALDRFAREVVGSHDHENFPHPIAYFLQIIAGDKDIVDVNEYASACQNLLETHIHHSLKCRWGIAHAKVHHAQLEQPLICDEHSLPLIPFPDSHIIEPPAHVNDCIVLHCL
jgi:hypothetical protein